MKDKDKYPLTLDHVKQYLATKQDRELVGACGKATWCLLSETLNYIYPEHAPWRVDIGDYAAPLIDRIRLPEPLERLRLIFDYETIPTWKIEVTKTQLRECLAIKTSQWTEEEAPFTFSDLFEETKA